MLRKLLLALCIAVVGVGYTFQGSKSDLVDYGWAAPTWFHNDPHALSDIPSVWVDSGKGQTRLLFDDHEQVHGLPYEPRNQGHAPSCVGQATAAACDFLASVQIKGGKNERAPPANASAATIYGWSRINIGQIDPGFFGGGSHCRWAVAAIQQYGVVPETDFPTLGIDLSKSSPDRDIEYGMSGVPVGLEAIGQRHVVVEYIKINSYEEARDAIKNGCPVVIGSSVGFGKKNGAVRDAEGFLTPPRNLFGFRESRWMHAMVLVGMSDEGRQGCLVLNSWGSNWISGPKRFGNEPEGSFWADKDTIDDIVTQGDSYAIRSFQGYVNYQLWK